MNNFLLQFQSDILNCNIVRPTISETTTLGAAFISILFSGFFKNVEELSKTSIMFTLNIDDIKRKKLY